MDITAAVARDRNSEMTIETLVLDDPREDELLIRIVGAGLCHGDLAVTSGIVPTPLPAVLGHEGAGIVERIGSKVQGFSVGDPVVLTFRSCGKCRSCVAGHPSYCEIAPALNWGARRLDGSCAIHDHNGGDIGSSFFGQSSFAGYAVSSARNTVRVRDDVPLELLGPMGCSYQTGAGAVLNVLRPRPFDTVVIFGCGAVGLAAMLAAKIAGVERVVAVDRLRSRLNSARDLGADILIDTSEQDLASALEGLGGYERGLDTTGSKFVIEAAIGALKMDSTLALVGAGKDASFEVPIVPMMTGRRIVGVSAGDADPATFIPYLVDQFRQGRFPIDRITSTYALEDINQAVADIDSGKTVKAVLVPGPAN